MVDRFPVLSLCAENLRLGIDPLRSRWVGSVLKPAIRILDLVAVNLFDDVGAKGIWVPHDRVARAIATTSMLACRIDAHMRSL